MIGGDALRGRRVLVPRGGAVGERLADGVRRRGGDPVIVPLVETAPPEDPAALAAAAARWNRGDYDWLVVTSANGAAAIAEAGARPGPGRVAAVGPATADALREHGFAVAVAPDGDFSAAGLATALLAALDGTGPARLLLPLSELAGTALQAALAEAGHRPERVTAYRTLPARDGAPGEQLLDGGAPSAPDVDAILVLSGSGARELARRFAPLPAHVRLAAIGRPTALALAEHGLRADVVAAEQTSDGLLDALAAALAATPPGPPRPPAPAAAGPDRTPGPSAPAAAGPDPTASPPAPAAADPTPADRPEGPPA